MDRQAFTKPFGKFIENREGISVFIPNKLPPTITYDESLTTLISEASLQLGNLSGIGKIIPNPNLLISPYLRQEAVLSSKIEGTQASILDIFRYEAGAQMIKEEERDTKRISEVINYVKALNICLQDVNKGEKIGIEMIRKAHGILMNGVKGYEKLHPGEFRNVQNWIGVPDTKIEDATYVPPPPDSIQEHLLNLEEFIQSPPGRYQF